MFTIGVSVFCRHVFHRPISFRVLDHGILLNRVDRDTRNLIFPTTVNNPNKLFYIGVFVVGIKLI